MKTWRDYVDKKLDAEDGWSDGLKDFYRGESEAILGIAGGAWLTWQCGVGAPGNTPGNTPDSVEACDMIEQGIKELYDSPGALIHLKEWRNGEYAKALGMTMVDILTLPLPKIGKLTAGLNLFKDGIAAGVAKLIAGELLTGMKNLGVGTIDAAMKKLGALKLTKLLELDLDLPKKLTFSPNELGALKLAIDVKGLPAVETALRGLPDGKSILDGLEDLLKKCVGDSFAPDTRVLLANGTSEPIVDIRLGDQVLATDPQTGVTWAEPVTQLHRNLDTELADVTVKGRGGDQVVQTTQHHPFWNATTRNWTDAATSRYNRSEPPIDSPRSTTPLRALTTAAVASNFPPGNRR